MKTYLLLGGAGYIGSALTKKLLNNKKNKIIVFDNFSLTDHKIFIQNKNLLLINDNISNIQNYSNIFNNIDVIYYLASPRYNFVSESTIPIELNNLEKTISLVNPTTKFILTSSCSVYGSSNKWVDENSPTDTSSPYSKLKICKEEILINSKLKNYIIFRLSTVYGRGVIDRTDTLINNIIENILNNTRMEIFSKNSYRPHIEIQDVVNILENSAHINFEEKIINVGFNDLNITKIELVKIIENIINKKLNVSFVEKADRSYLVNFNLLNKYIKFFNTSYEVGIFNYVKAFL